MTAVLVSRELLFATRLREIMARAGVELLRVDDPSRLPAPATTRLVLVDWAERTPAWGPELSRWLGTAAAEAQPRLILFGPHTDLQAHAAARGAGLGPMWARSRLVKALPELL